MLFLFATILFLNLTDPAKLKGQDRFEFSIFPGYHVVNSDEVSTSHGVSQTNWIFGGSLGTRFRINNLPLAYAIGFSYGKSTILEPFNAVTLESFYHVDLRYRTLPQELFWVHSITDKVELLTGINLTAQDRTLMYSDVDVEDDRLFSMGIGLSGKVHLMLGTFSSGNGMVFMNLSARWTEFIYHDKKDRNLDDFTLRHVTLSPHIGVSYRLR
ncbi:hypothetical protein QA596_03925 [Balneolales bacterium ANBcel1]|nr:hypothetical protein [Balneolales bacterium ANBcel1]